jgi:3-deoxy-manno-octulosonate cytidylyltransferase (CMP-KDO synthetase)
MANPIVLIPARMAPIRLWSKPLAHIFGEPMIVHVWRRTIEAGVALVDVAPLGVDTPEDLARGEMLAGAGYDGRGGAG